MRDRKQSQPEDSAAEQIRRGRALQSDLLRVVGAMGFSRSLLRKRGPWDEASRDPNDYTPYAPYDKLQTMIRDVVRTVANRGNENEQRAVRHAVVQFYETAMRDALEFLGEGSEADVIALTLETHREISEAQCALTTALTSNTPESFDRAARENTQALSVIERLRDVCVKKAREKFFTPRTVRLIGGSVGAR